MGSAQPTPVDFIFLKTLGQRGARLRGLVKGSAAAAAVPPAKGGGSSPPAAEPIPGFIPQ